MTGLLTEYDRRCRADSDIREYLPLLHGYARLYPQVRVQEIGVRTGNSTVALLAAAEINGGHVWSVDVADVTGLPVGMGPWQDHPAWTFTLGNSTDPAVIAAQPGRVDVLFLNAGHLYAQTLAELRAYMPRLVPGGTALFHDTRLPWGEGGSWAVSEALDAYCAEAGLTWRDLPGHYGLGVISLGW